MILHTTNGVAHTRWSARDHPNCDQIFRSIGEKPHGAYPLKEVWLHIGKYANYKLPPRDALRDLETLIIETDPDVKFDCMFFLTLRPGEDGVPFPRLSTLELRNLYDVELYGRVLGARSAAGFRLEVLRIGWSNGCEARMAPLAQFVDKLEFYHAADKTSRGLELPKECMATTGRWESWSRRSQQAHHVGNIFPTRWCWPGCGGQAGHASAAGLELGVHRCKLLQQGMGSECYHLFLRFGGFLDLESFERKLPNTVVSSRFEHKYIL